MTDTNLLKLMLHHILNPNEDETLRRQRQLIIEAEMERVSTRTTTYQAVVQVEQVIRLGVGVCGQGDDKRIVESGFEVKSGDQIFVYRRGEA